MGTGTHRNGPGRVGTGDLKQELKKAKEQYKRMELQAAQLEQLTWLNQDLLQRLNAAEQSHRSLLNYIEEMHRTLRDNFHRTPIEEIWYRELGKYLKGMRKKV